MEDNYTTWAQSMDVALTIKNKKGFIDGTLKRSMHNANEQNQWDQCNTLVKTWLLAAMSKENQSSIVHSKDARGMWLELQERFSQTNTVLLYNIENAIHGCEQGSSTVNSFYTKLKGLWDEKDALCSFPPCTCEAAREVKTLIETQKTMKFLMGLNESCAQTCSTIIGMDPLPNLNKAYAMVLRQEKQAETTANKSTIPSESSTFAVKEVNKGYNPRGGENRNFTPSVGTTRFCEKCEMDNHVARYCRAHLNCTYC
ncbi:hypothetical protein L6164_013073 [Bauhinia variegata]|uniref:Uncharacterized protein n=1 Tax=Bauhinia variegata TaxID=167791 RepID=A0ACB9PAZ8_BAUVA|nr:hypothetical protein L6164_013073 [Bauhinia variegata]